MGHIAILMESSFIVWSIRQKTDRFIAGRSFTIELYRFGLSQGESHGIFNAAC